MQTKATKNLLTPGELGDVLGVRSDTVRRWARQNKIPKLTLPSGRFVFDFEAVQLVLSRQGKPTILSKGEQQRIQQETQA